MASGSESEGEEGEELGIIRATLIRELRNVLDEYPDDGQILKEMIQNAEDAGASIMNFVSDTRQFNRNVSPVDIRKNPYLNFFKGPALYAFNNAMFSDRDWQGIRMIHTSVKEADPLKVGRFGLGFKSVFHMTDRLTIISGNHLLYMDPFKGEDRCCILKNLSRIKRSERESLLEGLGEIFGVGEEMFHSGQYPGTMFWFPLRHEGSNLSSTVYTVDKINDLWQAFKTEASGIPLFLKKIENVGLYTRRQDKQLSLDFQVGLATSCLGSVRKENTTFIEAIMAAGGQMPVTEVWSNVIKEVEMLDEHNGQSVVQREKWLVVNYHPGQSDLSPELAGLCEDPQLSYKPYVGVAAPLEGQTDFQSQIFCFLPLPLESRSPTGLPVHVNGFFALSQNRRHVKWPTADQLSHQAHMEPSLRWNRLLVEQLLPVCYTMLLTRLRELHVTRPLYFYNMWPDMSSVTEKWQPLVKPLLVTMATKPMYCTEGGQWVELANALLSTITEDISTDIKRTVHKAYVVCQENLIVLPQNVIEGLSLSGCLSTVAVTTPQRLSRLLQSCLSQFESQERCHLLSYLCDQKDFLLLKGLQLLPLQDGSFGVFTTEPSPTFFCQKRDLRLFPGLETHFCSCELPHDLRQHLHDIAVSENYSLKLMAKTDVCHLLMKSVQCRFSQQEPIVSLDDQWLQDVWNFLLNNFSDNLEDFSLMPLMPFLQGNSFVLKPLVGNYVCNEVSGMDPVSDNLATCLTKLGINVLSHMPDDVIRHPKVLGQLVQWPSPQGILTVLSHISECQNMQSATVLSFNQASTDEDRASLIKLLDDCRDTVLNINLQKLLQQLNLFSCLPDCTVTSIACVSAIAPDHLPPVPVPRQMLLCQKPRDRRVALQLGGQTESLQDISHEILLKMQPDREEYLLEKKQQFMRFFMDELLNDKLLCQLARRVKFLTSSSKQLKAVEDLYDPCHKLLKEVLTDDSFPQGEDDFIDKLQKLGLKDENQVTSEEFLQIAESLIASNDHPASVRRAQSLWTLLTSQISRLDSRALHELSQYRCLPVLHAKSMPDSYPCDLPTAFPEAVLVSPQDVYPYQYLALVGSVAPVADERLSSHKLIQELFKQEVPVETVLKHLANITKFYNTHNSFNYRSQLNFVYSYFDKNKENELLVMALSETPCLLVENEAVFLKPTSFWIEDNIDDVVLRPYRYRMSQEMTMWQTLFVACGTRIRQDSRLLLDVLSEIQAKHLLKSSQREINRDLKLVVQILETLKDYPPEERRDIILPIAHRERQVLRFRPAVECTVGDLKWLMEAESQCSGDEEVVFVHPKLPVSTALALGARGLMERALDETEDIDYAYHQNEPLTTRLHNLLEDSYTDGFSIPKELIQNADDAGAMRVKFLLDERQNEDCREHLLHPNMASLQGPALWVFNDATFSDQDFANIVKLGAGTKKDDASKVGKFGLGFNAVYNLSDVPSFISRNTIALFDPHKRHLPRGNPGMKIDLSLHKNRTLLKAVPLQFRPFEGVFGCSLNQEQFVGYPATLFRLPFRSEEQAALSDIKKESYSPEKRRQFLAMLIKRAGNLLLFTQNVKSVEVFHLSRDEKNTFNMTSLMSVTRESAISAQGPHHVLSDSIESILKIFSREFQNYFQTGTCPPDIRFAEEVSIVMNVRSEARPVCDVHQCLSQTEWRIIWASGVNQSARLALANKDQRFIPLAAAAVLLKDKTILSMNNCPFGFYQEGHLFCFLPLPEQMEQPVLPVHLNGTFALTSSRRNLLISTEENIDNKGGNWNSALVSDAVCRAYVLLLESLQDNVDNYLSYYELWPRSENGLSLVDSFYSCLINGNCSVFPSQNRWVSFNEATFFEPVFRFSQVGDLAFRTVLELKKDQIMLVDIPIEIAENFGKTRNKNAFFEKCLSEDFFYEHIFFPSIVSDFWKTPDKVRMRDTLTLHAINRGSSHVKRLVSTVACIPCDVSHELKTPDELVHPFCDAAALFLPEDGRFPQKGGDGAVDFCQSECLMDLSELGMTDDDLQWKDVIQRAISVKDLLALDKNLAFSRAVNIVDYLALTSSSSKTLRISQYSPDETEQLSRTEFLPVLTKPCDWPFPWFEDDLPARLAAPCELYHSNMTNLVACTQKLLDDSSTSSLRRKATKQCRRAVHESLKIVTQELPTHEDTVKSAVNQLLMVARFHESHQEIQSVTQKTDKICQTVYSFLQTCIESNAVVNKEEFIENRLKTERIIWTGSYFYHPAKLAFTVKVACPPYLQEISGKSAFKALFQFLGVRERFGTQEMLGVMEEMKQDVGDRQLSDDQVELFCRAAQLFCFARQETQDVHPLDPKQVSLPDKEGFLRCVSNLCLDDSSSLRLKPGIHFIHGKFSPEVAKTLGVKSKNSTIFKSHMKVKRFGQSEKLTNRIKRLLQGYTCDLSIFKEFIQNADDAGATEIRFIKDFRQLGTEGVPDGWKDLQGPALCVYNNADFTSKDIAGIQNLGEGSKGDEMMKTGQFGVGFNAVYHITDVPSFWTRRDGTDQVICVCDPCVLIPNEWQEPGMELEDIDSLKEEYPDLVDGYLLNTFDVSQPSSLFRLPLRTKLMATKSAIKKEPMTEYIVSSLLTDFLKDASLCLLFLNNVHKIGIYSTKDGRNLETEYEVEMVIDKSNALRKAAFREILSGESEMMIDDDLSSGIVEMKSSETIVNFSLKDSHGVQEDWIQVNRAGFLDASKAPEKLQDDWRKEHFRLLPRGGVAVKIKTTQPSAADTPVYQRGVGKPLSKQENIQSRVFCTLPLPVKTDLPVHINGHFALEHESRRNLWDREDDSRTMWNKLLCTDVIAPSYVKALEQVRFAWFRQKQHEDETSTEAAAKIPQFFSLFPSIPKTESSFWSPLVEAFYQQVINGRQALFPVTRADTASVTWTSIIKDKGFAGYFIRPPEYSTPVQYCYSANDDEKMVSDGTLAELLKRLNMKIVQAPLHVFNALKHYGANKIQEATLGAVLFFLKSCSSTSSDTCQLNNLPQPLADLGLDEVDVLTLATFVQKSQHFPSNIVGLPLCLLQSGILDVFSVDRKVFVTPFYDLCPMLSEEFLHRSLVDIFLRAADKVLRLLRFTIKHLAERLPLCLDQTLFKTGQPCTLNTGLLPSENWLQLFWEFFEQTVNIEYKHISDDNFLWCLNEWSLIPCKVTGKEECLVYPVKERKLIFCLSSWWGGFPSYEKEVVAVVQKLPLPIIDQSVVSQHLAKKLVASVRNPDSIVYLLRAFRKSLQLTMADARIMLCYFNYNLEEISQSGSSYYLREIPMFCAIGGHVTSLDSQKAVLLLPKGITQDGLEVWAKETETALLDPCLIPDEVCKILHLNKSSNLHMIFWRRLLSYLEYLPNDCVYTHILYIRENYRECCKKSKRKKELYGILSESAFIRVEPDRMCKASQFYSPHNDVFREMHDVDKFPPVPYCEDEWRDFMEKAGMVKEVTVPMFVSFATQLAAEGADALSEKTLTRSSTLVQHLFARDDLLNSGLLRSVCDICFVRPWSFQQTKSYKGLENICPPFVVNRLVSFSESCLSSNWPLLWSSTPILHPHDEPKKFDLEDLKEVFEQLNLEQNIGVECFKQHVVNVCHALNTATCNILHTSEGRREVEWLFDKIYEFLAEFKPEKLDFFKNIPVVFDSYNRRMLYPEQVVFGLKSDQVVEGWLFRAPTNYEQFRELFKALGVSTNVTANHYARVLTKLHEAYPNEPLEGDMLQACKQAVQGLFRCLKVSPDLNEKVIYLPNEQFCLKLSSFLFFIDNERLKTRLQCCFERFFPSFKQLDIHCVSPWGIVSLLPEEHRMAKLSEITMEVVPELVLSTKTIGCLAHNLKRKLLSVDFVNGITRLIYHKHLTGNIPLVETTIRQEVRELLGSIEVFETENFHTVLVVDAKQVTGSEGKHKIFRDKRFPSCVFVDNRASISDEDVDMTLADAAIETVGHDLHEFRFLLIFMLRCRDVHALLDKHNISSSHQGPRIKPGCYVNIDDLCLLDNNIENLFVSGEDIELEIYDPLIDSDEAKRGREIIVHQYPVHESVPYCEETVKKLDSLPCDTKVINSQQVFIYARVVKRIEGQNFVHPCCLYYQVDIGCGRTMVVSAVKMYKIPTVSDEDSSDESSMSLKEDAQSHSMSATSAVKQVKGCLEVCLSTIGDRRLQLSLLKRLYLQWHPDLNTTRQNVCSRVLRAIKQSTLPKGRGNSDQLMLTAAFFDGVSARGSLYASQCLDAKGEKPNLYGGFRRQNPQPGEANRWLCQAFEDLKMAKNCSEGNNWLCFICHQAAEKAIKAVLFFKDADDHLLHPVEKQELKSLALAVGNTELIRAVEDLELLTGERWRMSHPFVQWGPEIPALLYSSDMARSSCSQAEKILTLAVSLMI